MTGRGPTDQELALRDRSVRDFWARSSFHRQRLARAGFDRRGLRHLADLRRLPPMYLDDVESVSRLLPEIDEKLRHRRQYWPLQWVHASVLSVAYSAEDLALLGDLGRDVFEAAGAGPHDVVANVLPANASRDQLQLQLGAQVAGLSSASFGIGATVEQVLAISPSIIAGEVKELNRLFDAAAADDIELLAGIHTVIAVGPTPQARAWKKFNEHVERKNPETDEKITTVVRAWAPPGVFGLWSQCRNGDAFHTWTDVEIVEILDPLTGLPVPSGASGTIVWTGLQWYATAMLRLNTAATAAMFDEPCPTCGRVTSRLLPLQKPSDFSTVLDGNQYVDKWVAELQRTARSDELVIWIALRDETHSLQVMSEVDAFIGPARVQVVDKSEVQRRLADAKGERYGDRRALRTT